MTVDGNPAVTGMRIRREQEVAVDGKAVESREERILLAVYKPPGWSARQIGGNGGTLWILWDIPSGSIRWEGWIKIQKD